MSALPTAKHYASRAGVSPGQRESAGKRKSARTRKGLSMATRHADRVRQGRQPSKGTYLGEGYRRLARRRGDRKAIIAIAHEILAHAQHRRDLPRTKPRRHLRA
jgi:transposase